MVLAFEQPHDLLASASMRQHSLRLPDDLMQVVDSKRGLIPRNTWIVAAIKAALDVERFAQENTPTPRSEKPGVPEAERSPEPQASSEATQEPPARQRPAKPPLQRPIVQKRS